MSVQIAKVLRLDAQTREVMLASMGPRVGEQTLPAESDWTSNQLESEDDEERKPRNAAHDLLPKQVRFYSPNPHDTFGQSSEAAECIMLQLCV